MQYYHALGRDPPASQRALHYIASAVPLCTIPIGLSKRSSVPIPLFLAFPVSLGSPFAQIRRPEADSYRRLGCREGAPQASVPAPSRKPHTDEAQTRHRRRAALRPLSDCESHPIFGTPDASLSPSLSLPCHNYCLAKCLPPSPCCLGPLLSVRRALPAVPRTGWLTGSLANDLP